MTHGRSIGHYQRLLETYRALLRAYLDQQALWQPSEVPELIFTGTNLLRGQISQVKIMLRDNGAEVEDLTIDQPALDRVPERIQQLQRQLERQRRQLNNLLCQRAGLGGRNHTPSSITEQIYLTRVQISQLKEELRGLGASPQDIPDDVEW